ncbi:MAG: HYR domain-containing protein, partial [candidate division Zixibacteria bacterium]|nr:HYR domain-containing protein [candidate division Zixibacteria bacterium]
VPAPDTSLVIATDSCDSNPIKAFVSDVSDGQACPETITRTYSATDSCGNVGFCTQIITVNDTIPPVITCPANITVSNDPGLCSAVVTFSASATDNCPGVTIICDPPSDTVFPVGTTLVTCTATDACGNVASCTFNVTVIDTDGSCDPVKTCIALTQTNRADDGSLLPGDQHTPQGAHERVYIVHEAGSSQIGGFDFLIAYDASALAFTGASEGNVYSDYEWEFFTFRFGSSGNCSGGCPSGKLRVLGIANQSDGGHVPLTYTLQAGDTLACLDFLVSNDRTLECQFIPIRFCWLDCGDNVLSDKTGDTLSISCDVFDYQGTGSLGPEGNRADITDLNAVFPTFFGAPSADCEVSGGPGKPSTERKVNYKNGGIKIACADSIDARGDLNLNGLSNEIADAVLYTKYFINGISAFTIAPQGQIAASDVNADGLPLTVADLVYLIRVIVGDALPVPKLAHNSLSVEFDYAGGVFSTSHALGAALFVFDGQAEIDLLQSQVELTIGYREGRTYALIAPSMESRSIGEYIQVGELIATDAPLLSIEASDYDGAMVETLSRVVMPGEFKLHQNYPNPFNPSTKFSFELPVQTAYTLSVFNVSGQLVAKFSGVGVGPVEVEWNAASVASGIYFYKLSAGKFTSTRKALLLK